MKRLLKAGAGAYQPGPRCSRSWRTRTGSVPEPGALATAKINPEGNQMELKLGPVPDGRRHVKANYVP